MGTVFASTRTSTSAFQGLGTFKLTHSCVLNEHSTLVWSVLVSVQLSVSMAALGGFILIRALY